MKATKTPLLLLALGCLLAGCSTHSGQEGDRPEDALPPVGQDPSLGGGEPDLYGDLRQHTHFEAGSAVDPEIGPDGKNLYFASTHDTRTFNIYVKGIGSASIRRLTSGEGNERQPRVSPDGKWLAYISDGTGRWEIEILSLENPERPIRLMTHPGHKYGPSWDPTSEHLAFSTYSETSSQFHLWITQAPSGTEPTALDPRLSGLLPAFEPTEGQWLAFHRFRERGSEYASLWLIRRNGTEPTQIVAEETWGAITPAWSPDGQRIVFATVGKSLEQRGEDFQADDIWLVDRSGGALLQLTRHKASDWSPTWAGERIYFVSNRTGQPNIWSLPAPR